MKKIRILAALMALLLCVSMLLTACGNKNKTDDPATDATEEGDAGEGNAEGSEGADADKPEEEKQPEEEKPKALPTVKLADIMNKNWTLAKAETLTKIEEIKYEGTWNTYNARFFVTTQNPDDDSSKKITRIYDMNDTTKVVTLNDSVTTAENVTTTVKNYVKLTNAKYFTVITMKVVDDDTDGDNISTDYYTDILPGTSIYEFDNDAAEGQTDKSYTDYTFTIYGVNGAKVKDVAAADVEKMCLTDSANPNSASISRLDEAYTAVTKEYTIESIDGYYGQTDLCYIDSKVYRLADNGERTLVKDFGITKLPGSLTQIGENYLERYGDVYTVYDKSLNVVLKYSAPSYSYTLNVAQVLANGNLLVQYSVRLDEEAAEYDYISSGNKYDLVTILVTKDATTELTDVDYKISEVKASVAVDKVGPQV